LNSHYLYYWFCQAARTGALEPHFTGTTIKHLTGRAIAGLKVPLPPVSVQQEMVDVLKPIDEQINLLRQTNATLEAIAQAIFKSWFIDFDPVKAKAEDRVPDGIDTATAALFPDSFSDSSQGLLPEGWRVATVESFSERVGMGPFGSNIKVETFVETGIPVLSGQHLRNVLVEDTSFNFVSEEHANRLFKSCVQHGDVIFTHAGNIGQVSLLHEDSKYARYILSQRQFFLRCDKHAMRPEWITYFFKSEQGQHKLLANSSQVGVPSIARPVTYLRSISVPVPPMPIVELFSEFSDSLHKLVIANRREIKTLSEMRDLLLPRLISGKLRIPEAEELIEAAAA
jgi:type I restriction enzyme S subunit